jgi:hypothetical protein|tara:strand:+ start:201 stop:452 length:252 start_codon:yes stop_codon:yes gene_type:complete
MTPSNFNKKAAQSKKFAKASPTPKGVGEAIHSKASSKNLKDAFPTIWDLKDYISKSSPKSVADLCSSHGAKDAGDLLNLYREQ